MDGVTLEINRCCADPRYADVCGRLYTSVIRIGCEMGYCRFLSYTLPDESGSGLRAVGFQPDGVVRPTAPRILGDMSKCPKGEKLRWALH